METIKMKMDGTIRAKVLQYKNDGNTLTEKWHTLTKFAEGIYFSYTEPDRYGHRSVNIIFSKNGIFWRIGGEPEHYFNPDSFRYAENMETIKKRYANYEADILQAAANGGWLNKLHITVMERLGHDVAPLLAAYEERKRKWEENERKRIEAAEKAEQERKQAEERRKAELLAEGKVKLMANKAVTVEQIELLAEAVGYKIHIRTIGFMREKVSEAVLNTDETVTVWGRKLTQRNISGTADVLREIAVRIKAQAEQEAQQPATPAETPQIPTETAETVNVSDEGEKREETANMPKIYNCEWQTIEDFKKMPNISKLANAGIVINGVGYHTEYCNSKFDTLARVDNLPWDMDRHDFPYQGSGIFGKTELFDNWKDAVIATIDALTDYLQKQTPPEPIKEQEHLPQLPNLPHNPRKRQKR